MATYQLKLIAEIWLYWIIKRPSFLLKPVKANHYCK